MVHDEHLKRLAHLTEIDGLLAAVTVRGVAGSFRTQMELNERLLHGAREGLNRLGIGVRRHGQ